jgi:hypothetical protein
VDRGSTLEADRAVVPVGAREALVSGTVD